MTIETVKASPAEREIFIEEDSGYHKALKPRQIQMIAIGERSERGFSLVLVGDLRKRGLPSFSSMRFAASSPFWFCARWVS